MHLIIRTGHTLVRDFIAELTLARIATGLAVALSVAGLRAVAVQTVVAQAVVGTVYANVARLVTRIGRAANAVIAIDGRAGLTVALSIAGLLPVAE
jgi:hypothetical protein